jgi:hypothetical protein
MLGVAVTLLTIGRLAATPTPTTPSDAASDSASDSDTTPDLSSMHLLDDSLTLSMEPKGCWSWEFDPPLAFEVSRRGTLLSHNDLALLEGAVQTSTRALEELKLLHSDLETSGRWTFIGGVISGLGLTALIALPASAQQPNGITPTVGIAVFGALMIFEVAAAFALVYAYVLNDRAETELRTVINFYNQDLASGLLRPASSAAPAVRP